MVKYNLVDDNFSHHKSVNLPDCSVAGQESKYIIWDRTLSNKTLPTFYTHNRMMNVNTPKELSYGWIFESRAIQPNVYKNVENIITKFNTLFTHSSYLLEKYENTKWIPGGGIWVGGSYGGGEMGVKNKTKLCSLVSSNKSMCELHKFRTKIVNKYKNNNKIDVFNGKWLHINKTLDDYMFSIIVENFVDDLYFTEKILNCFATGTIPIYFGARNIGDIFNSDGILTFNDVTELDVIVGNLSMELYNSKIGAVRENFEVSKDYISIEDYIFKNYLNDEQTR